MNIKVYINEKEYIVNVDIEEESDFTLISTVSKLLENPFIDDNGIEKTNQIVINYSIKNSKYTEKVFFYE